MQVSIWGVCQDLTVGGCMSCHLRTATFTTLPFLLAMEVLVAWRRTQQFSAVVEGWWYGLGSELFGDANPLAQAPLYL